MKKFLLLSHYAPKPGFNYPESNCPLAHRETAHKRMYALDRFWGEGVLWQTLEVENTSLEDLMQVVQDPTWDAIWLSGSPYLLSEATNFAWIKNALTASNYLVKQTKVPVIGVCFGLQLLAKSVGASVLPTSNYKKGELEILSPTGEVLIRTRVYHENYVTNLPVEAEILGKTKCGMPYIVKFSKKVLGVQSHPECALESSVDLAKSEKFWESTFQGLID